MTIPRTENLKFDPSIRSWGVDSLFESCIGEGSSVNKYWSCEAVEPPSLFLSEAVVSGRVASLHGIQGEINPWQSSLTPAPAQSTNAAMTAEIDYGEMAQVATKSNRDEVEVDIGAVFYILGSHT